MSDHVTALASRRPSAMLPAGAGLAFAIPVALGSWFLALAVWVSGANVLWATLTLVLMPAAVLIVALAIALLSASVRSLRQAASYPQDCSRNHAPPCGAAAWRIAHV